MMLRPNKVTGANDGFAPSVSLSVMSCPFLIRAVAQFRR